MSAIEIKTKEEMNEKLFSLLKHGVSPFHVVDACEKQLKDAGFEKLNMTDSWDLKKGKDYYINHNQSTIIAFHVGKNAGKNAAFRMGAGHTDFPCLHIKPFPDVDGNGYAQVNVEVYGGAILNTWLDRPLACAGKVALKSKDVFAPKVVLFDSKDKILTIPNLAIHQNREVNKGVELNAQTDLLPVIGMVKKELEDKEFFLNYLASKLKVDKKDILDYEMFIYNPEQPEFVGIEKELISSPRLDNLTSMQALISGLLAGGEEDNIHLVCGFNHEEIGSGTKQGAGSMLLHHVMQKISLGLGKNGMETISGMYNGTLLSVDVAHALHPNHANKMDITNKPVLNKGFCIKEACAQSYATDCEAIGIVSQIAMRDEIPFQKFVNRSDVRGGGTLGSIASALTPVKTIDVGVPMLAMHSARECMGSEDEFSLYRLVKGYFA